ncbi:MAG TPA: diguanylate cyclase [Firmicutes bacterium]|nr:diguanylate cyclase [Bacillota bacterium]
MTFETVALICACFGLVASLIWNRALLIGLRRQAVALRESEDRCARLVRSAHSSIEEVKRKNEELRSLHNACCAVASSLDLDAVLRELHSAIRGMMDASTFYVALYNEQSGEIKFQYIVDNDKAVESFVINISDCRGFTPGIIKTRKPVFVRDRLADPSSMPAGAVLGGYQDSDTPRSIIGIPLVVDNRVVGVLSVQSPNYCYSEDDLRILTAISTQAAMAIENARLCEELKRKNEALQQREEELRKVNEALDRELVELSRLHRITQELAVTDPVTGLYNYRYFQEHLTQEIERAQRYRRVLSLIMVDIDDFKIYNDTHGHQAGDAVLRAVARLIARSVRGTDIVARYGGEEFVVILIETEKKYAVEVAEKIRSRIASYRFPNEETQPSGILTVSVGVATYPDDAKTKFDLINAADMAMYRSKKEGRNRVYWA